MKINVNKLMDYYAQANVAFYDTFSDIVPSGRKGTGARIHREVSGLIFPLEGSARFSLNGTPYVLTPGMVVHAGPDMHLDKEVIGNKSWSYAVVHYQIPGNESVSSSHYYMDFNVPVGTNLRLKDMVSKILESDTTPGNMAALRRRSLFHNLIEEIVMSAKRQHKDNNGELIEDAIAFIHENYSGQLTIGQLAKQYGLDGRRFAELFQRHISMSPIQYLTELRIKRSKDVLRTSNWTVMEVAESVGYTDPFYFSKLFKKHTGISPTEFRAETGKRHI